MSIFSISVYNVGLAINTFFTSFVFLQKLLEISRLKEQRANGKTLEINQIDKMKKEDQLIKELQELTL